MSELEDKLSAVLGNPQTMQQIMSLAQSLGQQDPPKQAPEPPPGPNIDPAMLQKIAGMASRSSVDPSEQALLTALSPYLSQSRVKKLERAMRAAKLAGVASSFLGANIGGR